MFKLWTKALAEALRPACDVPAVEICNSRTSRFQNQGNAKSKAMHITEVILRRPCENTNSLPFLEETIGCSILFNKAAETKANAGVCTVDGEGSRGVRTRWF
jgi:hypothetical protein